MYFRHLKYHICLWAGLAALAWVALGGYSCRQGYSRDSALNIALDWNDKLLMCDRYAEGFRTPISARMWAYTQIAVWEATLPGNSECRSVIRELGGPEMPHWKAGSAFSLPVAVNAAYSTMANRFFYHLPSGRRRELESFTRQTYQRLQHQFSEDVFLESRKYGETIANAVFNWSMTDSVGHMAHMFNYDRNYIPDTGAGKWVPDEWEPMPPLLPAWGNCRTFVVDTGELQVVPPLAYSESAGSPLFAEAMETYNVSFPVTEEKRWIAEFWRDDIPDIAFTGSSRWISIACQAISMKKLRFPEAMELLLKIGIALNDAAVNVWKVKYQYQYLRPTTFIRKRIDLDWQPMHNIPPFPGYPSGHSAFGQSAAVILTQSIGTPFPMKDRSHEGNAAFLSTPRKFDSFEAMARENAYSRILIGAHFRMDCDEGLREGQQIGERVSALSCRRDDNVLK